MESDQTSVEKLAAAKCSCSVIPDGSNWYAGRDCPTCGGTGIAVPGLRKRCGSYSAYIWCDSEGIKDEKCVSCGRYAKSKRHKKFMPPHQPDLCKCQGRGWVLIPAAEVMGVLVRAAPGEFFIWANASKGWSIQLQNEAEPLIFDEATPEEALAAAICQALGVTTKMQGE